MNNTTSRRGFFQRFFSKTNAQQANTPIQIRKPLTSEPYLAEIILVPYNFAPRGWARCEGQILSIAQNTALFSLLGTTYGGNGTTNFALPDLRNAVAMGTGQGPGLSDRTLGEMAGTQNVTVAANNLPSKIFTANAVTVRGVGGTQGVGLAKGGIIGATTLSGSATPTPIDIRPPFLGLYYIIATQGIFPPRP